MRALRIHAHLHRALWRAGWRFGAAFSVVTMLAVYQLGTSGLLGVREGLSPAVRGGLLGGLAALLLPLLFLWPRSGGLLMRESQDDPSDEETSLCNGAAASPAASLLPFMLTTASCASLCNLSLSQGNACDGGCVLVQMDCSRGGSQGTGRCGSMSGAQRLRRRAAMMCRSPSCPAAG